VLILQAAKEWGVKPWELDNSEPPLVWLIRWKRFNEIRATVNG
jgi:hypothetical protein